MRHTTSRAEELQQRLKQKISGYVPALCILALAMFSLGVAKAFNWKIALFVFIILVAAFETGSRLFQKLFNPNVEKFYSGYVVGIDCPSRDHAQMKRLDKLRSEVSNSEGKRIA